MPGPASRGRVFLAATLGIPRCVLAVKLRPVTRPDEDTKAAPERNVAKEQLVGTLAAAWGSSAAESMVARIKSADGDEAVRALVDELARSILAEAVKRFGDDPALA